MAERTLRIAMWSGPRNISTALMRSWGNRSDCWVCDEPLYAFYLSRVETGHPGADEVMAHHETDWQKVVHTLTGPVPGERPIFYQKHMAHHLLPEVDRHWLAFVENCFLIRDPREMLLSLSKVVPEPQLPDTGLQQQVEMFESVAEATGDAPPVIDSRDVLIDPAGTLSKLCSALGVRFEDAMLSWPPGRRETDGIWAPHWYANVERSTCFAPYRARDAQLPASLEPVLEQCQPYYETLYEHRL